MTVRVGWYGDDFTGATDTLAVASQAGLRSLLFLDVPTAAQLAKAGSLDAVGIAGSARCMNAADMQTELHRIGRFAERHKWPVLHYKCCSTFDSSPTVGSIGTAVSVLKPHVGMDTVMIVGGQPNIGRYCCFGNLFAAESAGGAVHRLDRHPTMSRHPVTPMAEADLRVHLAAQGMEDVRSIPYPAYGLPDSALAERIDRIGRESGSGVVLLDVADASHLAAVGAHLWRKAQQRSVLAVGSSVVVQALAAHWAATDAMPAAERVDDPCFSPAEAVGRKGPVFALAGSMSPVTARQVERADAYFRLPLDAARLIDDAAYAEAQVKAVLQRLDEGTHVLAYVANPDGPAMPDSRRVAEATADFVKRVVMSRVKQGRPLHRIGIAGGDTSSLATRALDVWALAFVAMLAPGVCLCRTASDDAALHGMELMLKGGQMGTEDLFQRLLDA